MNILISGYIGYGNSGDDAILSAICKGIRQLNSDAKITALSYKPELTIKDNAIEAVHRFNWREIIKAVKRSDILISGGGSLLQDSTSTRSLLYYLGIIELAKKYNKKVMLYANGIGPIQKKWNKKVTKHVINKVDLITLRENISGNELSMLGISKPPIHITADPVFSLPVKSSKRYKMFLQHEDIPLNRPLVGVLFRQWYKDDTFIDKIASICDKLIEEKRVNVVFIPMQYKKDLQISTTIARKMKYKTYILDKRMDTDTIIGIIGEMHMVLSMRLHALLFAAIQSIPMLGFVYDPKVNYYLKVLDMPSAGHVYDLETRPIMQKIDHVFNNYTQYQNKLKQICSQLRQQSFLNNHYLMTLIKSKKD